MDIKKMTRAKAEKAVAATTDLEVLRRLGDHVNKHVRAKAAHKFARLSPVDAQLAADVAAAGAEVEGAS